MIDIKDIKGNTIYSTEINSGSTRKFELMQSDCIVLKFSLETPLNFPIGCYVDEISLGLFERIDNAYKPRYNTSTGGYDYELQLDAYYRKWKNKIFKFTPEVGGQEASWSLTASLDVHLSIFLKNLQALGYKYRGIDFEFSIDSTVENKAIGMTYDNTNMLDALSSMAERWECEWWVTDNIIYFGRCEYGTPVDFILNENVAEMSRSESKSVYATRIYAFGSTRNIPSNYRPVDGDVTVNGIVQRRLMLPEGKPYVDAYENMSEEEAIEQVVVFDDVYPRTQGSIDSVTTYEDTVENEDGTTTTGTFYRFTDSGIKFSKDYILEGEELRIKFERGLLNGMDFGVAFNPNGEPEKLEDGSWNPAAQLFEIVVNDDYGRPLPDEVLKPKEGDTYVLYGWDSTKIADLGLIDEAEKELLEKANEYVKKSMIDPNTYNCKMMSDYMYGLDNEGNQNPDYAKVFEVGDRVNLINKGFFEEGRQSRIIGYEYNLDFPYDNPTYTVGETASYSRIGDIEDKIDAITFGGQVYTGGGGSGVYIIGTNDTTKPTNRNVYSALKSDQSFLRKDLDDRTPYSLSVGGTLSAEQNILFQEKPINEFVRYHDEEKPESSHDAAIYSALMTDKRIDEELTKLEEKYIRKDKDDRTEFSIGIGGDLSVDGKATITDTLSLGTDIDFRGKQIAQFTRYYDEVKPDEATDVAFYSALMTDKRIEDYLKGIDDKYLRKDKEDTAHKHITFEEGIKVYELAEMANIKVEQLATIARAIIKAGEGMQESISSEKFVDGILGEGFRIWRDIAAGEWNMTLDRLTVRKVMMIYELIIQKIRSAGGMIVVSAGNGIVKEVKEVGLEYFLTFEDANSFVMNDLIRCQVFTGNAVKQYWVEVTGVNADGVYARIADFDGVLPEVGDEVVLMGNTKNKKRQNLILISATEDGQPRFDCYDGVSTKNFENCLKVRVGALDGIVDSRFPVNLQPKGYGLYGNNCYLTGVFVLSNGTDVQTQFSILEGQIVTEISSVRAEINNKDNYLSNASFSHDLDKWVYENDVRVFDTEGGLLHFNDEFYSDKRIFTGIVKREAKNVLRIKNGWIRQMNSDFNLRPTFELFDQIDIDEDGNETVTGQKYRPRMFYVSFSYLVAKEGKLTIRFNGEEALDMFETYTPIHHTESLGKTSSYSLMEIEGKWNGTGNFEISFDGDIYIYGLALSDNRLADVEEKFTERFEMTDKKIQSNLDHIIENGEKLEEYHSEMLLTAEELTVTFNRKIEDQYSKITTEYTGKVTQTAQSLTSDYTKKVSDSYEKVTSEYTSKITQTAETITATLKEEINDTEAGLMSDYNSKITATAQSLTSDYTSVINDLKNGTIREMQSTITQQAGQIALRATKDEFNALGERVSSNEANIILNAEGISMNAKEVSNLGTRYAELQLTADGLVVQVENVEGDVSKLTQTADRIEIRVASAEGNISALTQTANGLESKVSTAEGNISTLTQTADRITSRVASAEGNISTLTQTANGLESKVSTAEGNISTLTQTADRITSRVASAEGNISTLTQTANGLTSKLSTAEGDISTLEQRANEISAKVSDVDGKYSSLSIRVGAIESIVGDGVEGDFSGFQESLKELTDKVTANTKAAAAAQSTADKADKQATANLTTIEQTSKDITALAASIKMDNDGNITNISTSGLVLTGSFASLFTTEVNTQGIAKTAQLNAYVKEDELGNKVSQLELSADQIDLTGKVTFDDLSDGAKSSIRAYSTSAANALATEMGLDTLNSRTLISGGYIRTSLIDADAIVVKKLEATDGGGYRYLANSTGFKIYGSDDIARVDLRLAGDGGYLQLNDSSYSTRAVLSTTGLSVNEGMKVVDVTANGVELGEGSSVMGLAVGNFSTSAILSDTDFAIISSDHSLPNPSFWKGKIVFVRTKGERKITSSSSNIYPRGDNSLTNSLTRNNSSQFFVSDGTYWYEFFCG